MAEVYLARDDRLERHVAVKLLPEARSVQAGARGRMLREARAASALKHPSIVTVYDIGEHDGKSYIVMEYVDGETFSSLIDRRGALPAAEAVELLARVADAVAAAHAAGVLHRDIKSPNLMIDRTGQVKVLDFGLSKRTASYSPMAFSAQPNVDSGAPTQVPGSEDTLIPVGSTAPEDQVGFGNPATAATAPTSAPGAPPARADQRTDEPRTKHGARMGTPGWAPPELMDGRPADVRTDVFSLGCVLYHLLTGQPPFEGDGWNRLREQIERGPTPPSQLVPALPAALDPVLLAALAADPADRPATVTDLVEAARAALGRPRRPRSLLFPAALAAAALAVIAVVVTRGGSSGEVQGPGGVQAEADLDAAPAPPPVPTRLTSLGGCAYSPTFVDDDTLVFDLTRDNAVDLYRYQPGEEPVRLTSDPGWEWRAGPGSGEREVIFIRQGDEGSGIDAIDIDTGARRTLAPEAAAAACARDVCYYAPTNGRSLRRIRGARDESFVTLPPGRTLDTLVASADGAMLAMVLLVDDTSPSLCMVDLADPRVRCLNARATTARPAFSTIGRRIYFEDHGVSRIDLDSDLVTSIIPGVVAGGGIAVSPSGDALVYSDCKGRSILVDVVDDPTRPLVDEPSAIEPAFGPDGVLAYVRVDGARQQIMLLAPGHPSRELVAGDGVHYSDLALSADGERLAYVMGDPKRPGIYLATVRTVALPNRLTTDATDATPVFVGDQIVFTRRDPDGLPHLMRVGLDGSDVTRVAGRARITLAAAPDGSRVLVTSPARDFLYWWNPVTGREKPGPKLPRGGAPADVDLSPDGNWLMVIAGPSGQSIWRRRLEGRGRLEQVAHLRVDQSAMEGAIDDRGHPLVGANLWLGDLWRVAAPAGRPW